MRDKSIVIILLTFFCLMVQTNQIRADVLDEDEVISNFKENGYIFTEEEEQAIREEIRKENEMKMNSSDSNLLESSGTLPGKILYDFFKEYELEDMKEDMEFLKENLDGEELKQNMCAVFLVSSAFSAPFYEVDENVDVYDYETDFSEVEYIYTGNVTDEKPDGIGTLMKYNEQSKGLDIIYVGEFKGGRCDGIGIKYEDTSHLHVGEYVDGKLKGKGASVESTENEIIISYGNYKDDKIIEDSEMRSFSGKIDESTQEIVWKEKENDEKYGERSIFDFWQS